MYRGKTVGIIPRYDTRGGWCCCLGNGESNYQQRSSTCSEGLESHLDANLSTKMVFEYQRVGVPRRGLEYQIGWGLSCTTGRGSTVLHERG